MTYTITVHIEDNKSILMAYRDGVEDHVYWADSTNYKPLLEDFYLENPEYKNCEVIIDA